MNRILISLFTLLFISLSGVAQVRTVCNPVDLSYMFSLDTSSPSYREAADPSLVLFKDEYYLFVSKSGGYFHSEDLITWNLISTKDLPLDNYAPTAVVIGDEIYFMTSGHNRIYKTSDPKSGEWKVAKTNFSYTDTDPMLFLDDDGRLYYYGGCSNVDPIRGGEIDPVTFNKIGSLQNLIYSNTAEYGWEVPGDFNASVNNNPWIEGAWMNKYKGKYYLQYAGPGTEFKSYNDGVYVSDNPLGPFTLAKHNPFAYKPEGFACGAGHGSTFCDKYGNYWHLGTVSISKRHSFERRISLFPVFFDNDDFMYAYTGFGDYPMIIPDKKIDSPEDIFPGWMLLSYSKEVEVSSTFKNFVAKNAVNEDIRTWWSAETNNPDEYISLNLGDQYQVHAIQLNFADQDANLSGRNESIYYQYQILYSSDGTEWKLLVDKSNNTIDAPNDYIQLDEAVDAQYLKLCNIKVPSGKISLSGFRVFGIGSGDKPEVQDFSSISRWAKNQRNATVTWSKKENVTGYNIRYGVAKDKLYLNYMMHFLQQLKISSLNVNRDYYFTIDAFNENGITRGTEIHTLSAETSLEEILSDDFVLFFDKADKKIHFIPNPNTQSRNKVSLYNLQGLLMATVITNDTSGASTSTTIDAAGLPPGVYIVSLDGKDFRIRKKVIITN